MKWLLILLLPFAAIGQTYTRVSDLLYLTPEDVLAGHVLTPMIYNGTAQIGGSPVDLTDMTLLASFEGGDVTTYFVPTLVSATNGSYSVTMLPNDAAANTFKVQATTASGESFGLLAWHSLTIAPLNTTVVTNIITTNYYGPPLLALTTIGLTNNNVIDASIAEGAFSGMLLQIDNTTITTGVVGIAVTEGAPLGVVTNENGVAVINIPPSSGSGGGDVTINGVASNAFSFVGQFPVSVSNIGSTFYFGQLGGGGTFIPAGDSNQVFNFTGATNSFTVPIGVTELYVYAWGAGGGGGAGRSGGAGGYSFGYFSVTNGEVLSVVIGEGGFVSSATVSTAIPTNTANPWPNGGWGASRHTARAGAGGGSTAILRDTNYLVVAGGGGGSGGGATAGGGGGTLGQDGFSTVGGTQGGGGTQTAGGTTGSTTIPLSITNTAGSFYRGGNGGLTTNLAASTAGGGGGGWYGGAGGLTFSAVGPSAGGGGGSGHINSDQGVVGTTIQAQTPTSLVSTAQPPPATDDPLYGSPTAATWGQGGASTIAGGNGGMIIRWVQP